MPTLSNLYRNEQFGFIMPESKTTHKKKAGRLRMNNRQAMNAIFYILRTGCQWNALPRSLGSSSTVHDKFEEWRTAVYSSLCGLMVC
jgi:transposase